MTLYSKLTTFLVILSTWSLLTPVSSLVNYCVSDYCLTVPDFNTTADFDGAKHWCNANNSTLAIVTDIDTQNALSEFLSSFQLNVTVFLNAKRTQYLASTWFLRNGSRYYGDIQDQNDTLNRLYCSMSRPMNQTVDSFQLYASAPYESKGYICMYEESRCSIQDPTVSFMTNGWCYVKYEDESLNWFQSRERCLENGGDLAYFNHDQYDYSHYSEPPVNTSWLNSSLSYWIGIRWNNVRWFSPDDGNETVFFNWSNDKPNNNSYNCLCMDPSGTPAWSWTDCSCTDQKLFVCLEIVPNSTFSVALTSTAVHLTGSPPAVTEGGGMWKAAALAIGLGVGIGGGALLLLLLIQIVAFGKRRCIMADKGSRA